MLLEIAKDIFRVCVCVDMRVQRNGRDKLTNKYLSVAIVCARLGRTHMSSASRLKVY